jgi:PKD repeat protein
VQFTDLSGGYPETWFWLFGDGSSGYQQHPSHQYLTPGDFSVSLRVKRGTDSSNILKNNYIKVVPPLVTDFTSDKQLAFVDEIIQFTDLSTGNPENWFWDFGNFSNAINQHPVVSFSEPGTYTIQLKVANQYLQDSMVKDAYITVIEPLTADFTSDLQQVKIGEKVLFFDLTTGSPESWEWWFSSGDTSTLQNPSLTVWEPGFVDVTLIVSNQYLQDTITKLNYLFIEPPSYSQVITLEPGWSGISSYIQPLYPSIETIFAPVADKLLYAVNEQGVYWPALNLNTIGFWDTSKGLIVKMDGADTLTIEGYSLVDNQRELMQGWNLFPIISSCEQPLDVLPNLLESNFLLIKNIDATEISWPAIGVNNIDTLKPGKSYFILISEEAIFAFPACSGE